MLRRRKPIEIQRLPAFWSKDPKGKYARFHSKTTSIRGTEHTITYSTHSVPNKPGMLIQKRVFSEDGRVTWDVGRVVKEEGHGIVIKPITQLGARRILNRLAKEKNLP